MSKFKVGQRWLMRCPYHSTDYAKVEKVESDETLIRIYEGGHSWLQWIHSDGSCYSIGQSRYDLVELCKDYEIGELRK